MAFFFFLMTTSLGKRHLLEEHLSVVLLRLVADLELHVLPHPVVVLRVDLVRYVLDPLELRDELLLFLQEVFVSGSQRGLPLALLDVLLLELLLELFDLRVVEADDVFLLLGQHVGGLRLDRVDVLEDLCVQLFPLALHLLRSFVRELDSQLDLVLELADDFSVLLLSLQELVVSLEDLSFEDGVVLFDLRELGSEHVDPTDVVHARQLVRRQVLSDELLRLHRDRLRLGISAFVGPPATLPDLHSITQK